MHEQDSQIIIASENKTKATIALTDLVVKINQKRLSNPLAIEKHSEDQLPEIIHLDYLNYENSFMSSNIYAKHY